MFQVSRREVGLLVFAVLLFLEALAMMSDYSARQVEPIVQYAEVIYTHYTIVVEQGKVIEARFDETYSVACDAFSENDEGQYCVVADVEFLNTFLASERLQWHT